MGCERKQLSKTALIHNKEKAAQQMLNGYSKVLGYVFRQI